MLLDRAYMGLRSYADYPVALHSKAEMPFTWTDLQGLCAKRIHCADTFNSHVRGFDSSNAQVVHARLAAIIMNDDRAV